ncbi:MAG TPA: CorA family divalent cation transporter, partial [Solirubrobacteraceae bacterium]|nr:CorA family divalent cation transporter [Solirubrobacteraceae bacterium]
MPRTRCYRDGLLTDEDFPLADVSEHLDLPDAVVWVDLCAPDPAEVGLLADELGLHRLAVEDALHPHQRAKLDRYSDHAFLSAYTAHLDADTGQLEVSEIAVFITAHAL